LIRYMDLQPKDGEQDRDIHFPRGTHLVGEVTHA